MQSCADLRQPLSLRNVLADARFVGVDDVPLTACTADSREVRPGMVFVAMQGASHDGHSFIADAVDRGCSAVVAQQPVMAAGVPVCYMDDTRVAFGRICHALAGDPSKRLKVIGITGTNGKTTTSCLIASILTTAGHRIGILGTLGCFDGREVAGTSHTTLPADKLARCLGRMVRNDCSHAVMEVSSHALDQGRIEGMAFDAACVTNVRRDHLDYHRSIHEYRSAKLRLLDHLAGEGFAVINADDPVARGYLGRIDGPVLTVAMHREAEITATLHERTASEQTILLSAGNDVIPVRTRMIGAHHAYNCLVAAAVGLAYGIDLPTVVRGLEAIDFVPGRLERIECGQPFSVFVDFAHTPDALEAVLKTLREVTGGRLICIFGAGGERDRGKRPLMGRAVETHADLAVITDDNPRGEDPQEIIEEILGGLRLPAEAEVIPDRSEAIAWALSRARPGDCVLIAGKGHETTQIIGQKRYYFDDRQVARQWLYASLGDEAVVEP
jgi:UDP-N-acetylmuramoyl-L-alanyl-D-glutamate--2,6-diaminopimelate ligase